MLMTEDKVRNKATKILGFDIEEKDIKQGTGQITTFNQLGFNGFNDRPDGWYLPKNKNEIAIILETKSEKEDIDDEKWIEEIRKNCDIVLKKYKTVIGILYNGISTRGFKNNKPIEIPNELQHKSFYIKQILDKPIDKQKIYSLTERINDSLHFDFGIKNLYHRMIFTVCALVAERYNSYALVKNVGYQSFHSTILSTLNKSLIESNEQNNKLDILSELYSEIKMNFIENQEVINNFIDWIKEISKEINSNHWNGEDVMGIFFNEFNRYKQKAESGQVFTPDHITSFMYRLINCNKNDYILDAACGSGAFLVKAMSNMIIEAGGVETNKAKEIKNNQLFGIELDREIFALACANMLIHKDGKSNIIQFDSTTEKAKEWIEKKHITKVLMNPPFENRYGCIDIVINVLNSVKINTKCAFILPDKKLEKTTKKKIKNILKNHRLIEIIKLPENLFSESTTTSIFVFESGIPQNDNEIFACYIEDDGLETVKNQGRQDIRNKWEEIENYWINAIKKRNDSKYNTHQWLNPKEHLSYQKPTKPFEIYEEDFKKTMLDYLLFERKIDVKEMNEKLLNKVLYNSDVEKNNSNILIKIEKGGDENE